MTAEEVALEEFRETARMIREAIKWRRLSRRRGEPEHMRQEGLMIQAGKARMRIFARIIRAIRAERENRPRIVDVDVLGIAPKEVYPEPVDRHTSSSWQMYRFRFGDLVEIDLGRGRVIRIHGGPRAGAAEEAAR